MKNDDSQVRSRILALIREKGLTDGSRLPSAAAIAKSLEVGVKTIKATVQAMADEGILEIRSGKGTYLKQKASKPIAGRTVGVAFPQDRAYVDKQRYPGEIFFAFEEELSKAGLRAEYFPLASMKSPRPIEVIKEKSLAGLVLFEVLSEEFVRDAQDLGLPVISLDTNYHQLGITSVVIDNSVGTFEGTSLLIQSGHKRIAFIHPVVVVRRAEGRDLVFDPINEERLEGYRIAMRSARLPIQVEKFYTPVFREGDIKERLLEVLEDKDPPTAFVSQHDWVMMRLCPMLFDLGYRIPDDISLMGFGGTRAEFAPGQELATVDVDYVEMGRQGAEMMVRYIEEGNGQTELYKVETRAVPNDSIRKLKPDRAKSKAKASTRRRKRVR